MTRERRTKKGGRRIRARTSVRPGQKAEVRVMVGDRRGAGREKDVRQRELKSV